SREVMEMPACYKHSAPLEPGGDGNACVLQTFGSAGAGRRCDARGATNIRLRWSRAEVEWLGLQTFGSAGAGRRRKCLRPTNIRLRWSRAEVDARGATNIRLRWSREVMEMPACYKHSAPLEPGGDGTAWATNIRLRWSRAEMRCSGGYKHSA